MSSPQKKEKVWNFIKDIKVGMMTTQDGKDFRSRPMHLVQDDYNGTIWFYTKVDSEKVEESAQQSVCISFCDHGNNLHVSLSGTAKLSFDKKLIDKFWSPFVAAWFPEGKNDPNVALLEIKIHKGEYWNSDSNMFAQLYKIAKANITNEKPDMSENKKFG